MLRRRDRLALPQLCESLAQLEAENEELRRQLVIVEDDAEHWRQNALELAGESPGLAVDDNLVRLEVRP